MTTEQAIVNTVLALTILGFISLPFYVMLYFSRNFIKRSIAGVDGVPDIYELRIWSSIMVMFAFVIIFLFLIITMGALKWPYPSETWILAGLGTCGAEALIYFIFRKKKKDEQGAAN